MSGYHPVKDSPSSFSFNGKFELEITITLIDGEQKNKIPGSNDLLPGILWTG